MDAGVLSDTVLMRDLTALADDLEQRFSRSGQILAEAIETVNALLDGLERAGQALDPQRCEKALSDLRQSAQIIQGMPQALRRRDADLGRVAIEAEYLGHHVRDILLMLQMLTIYGMNIKIAGAGGDFRIFVDDMTAKLSVGETEMDSFAKRLAVVAQNVAQVRAADAQILAARGRMGAQLPRDIREYSERMEANLARCTITAERLSVLTARVRDAVNGVLCAIQVADSTHQRLSHVIEALNRINARARTIPAPQTALDQLARLLGAQLLGAARDHMHHAGQLNESLAGLAAAGSGLGELIDQYQGGEGTTSLQDLHRGISSIEEITVRLRDTAARARTMSSCIVEATRDLTCRVDSIDQIVRDVREIAINTRLLCHRQGQQGVAVAVIAVEVAAQAKHLQGVAGAIGETIERLGAMNARLAAPTGGQPDADLGQVMAGAIATIRHACQQGDQVLADGRTQARRLIGQIDDAAHQVSGEARLASGLDKIVARLDCPPSEPDAPADAWLRELLPDLGRLYTMTAERDIHNAIAPGSMGEVVEVVAPVGQDLDMDEDGLF